MKTPSRVFRVFSGLALKALRDAEQLRITMTCIALELSPFPWLSPNSNLIVRIQLIRHGRPFSFFFFQLKYLPRSLIGEMIRRTVLTQI